MGQYWRFRSGGARLVVWVVHVGPWFRCDAQAEGGFHCEGINAASAQFQGFRVLLCIALAACLLAGLLTALQLAMQQRGARVGMRLELLTALAALLAWATTTTSFGLACALFYSLLGGIGNRSLFSATYDASWALHLVAMLLLDYGLTVHALSTWRKRRGVRQQGADGGAAEEEEAASGSLSASLCCPSAFSLSSPVQVDVAQPQLLLAHLYGQRPSPPPPTQLFAPQHIPAT